MSKLALTISFTIFIAIDAYGQLSRIKDLVHIRGDRPNNLIGLGLIVGLAGTGDTNQSLATTRAATKFMERLGMDIPEANIITPSVAFVVLTAKLPPFAKNGDKIDINVSVIGDATSIAGGTLMQSPLKGPDGKVYVIAQGAITLGQARGDGNQTLTGAYLAGAGTVERDFNPKIVFDDQIHMYLNKGDYSTSLRIAKKINTELKGFYADPSDPSLVKVNIPDYFNNNIVGFIAKIENLKVKAEQKAVVVVNQRSGTIVLGSNVTVAKVVISHRDLSIQVGGAEGEEVKEESTIATKGTSVGDLIKSLNSLGVKPEDLVGILKTIHASGGLNADLKFL